MFPERCDRGAISYLEGERVPKNWCVVTERIRKVFDWGLIGLQFGGASPCIFGRGIGVN